MVVLGDVDEKATQQTCREIAPNGGADWVPLDLRDRRSARACVEGIRRKHGPVQILVNNAGVTGAGLFADKDPSRLELELAVDLVGAIYLTRLVLPDMIASGWGRIASVSSMMAFAGAPGFAVYSAAKAGLRGFSEALGRELRSMRDVRVTVVFPPSVKTRAFEEAKRSQPDMMRWTMVPPISVEQAARRTVHGVVRGRPRVYCSVQSYLASVLQRFVPRAMDLVLRTMFRGNAAPRVRAPVNAPAAAAAASSRR
jgi:short-subunit dehydrogenase